jgi:hypothetical protein
VGPAVAVAEVTAAAVVAAASARAVHEVELLMTSDCNSNSCPAGPA